MRRLHFDPSFDGGVWTGPREASAGESWVGPLGALGVLEGQLGLTAKPPGAGVRIGQALRGLTEAPTGFWKRSLAVDGLATARELLHWADWLKLHGWEGEGGDRLGALWGALRELESGPAERLERLLPRLEQLPDVRFALETFAPLTTFAPMWRSVLEAAACQRSTRTLEQPDEAADGLKRALGTSFIPDATERTLQLIRPHGLLVAADLVAAALAATPKTPTLIIGSDPTLDAALKRYGLATTGAPQTPHDNVLGELLPLLVELGLSPADPGRALEFLTIPGGPIHARVTRRLVGALQRWPAVGSPAWQEALARPFEGLEPDALARARDRLGRVFDGNVREPNRYPTRILLERVSFLRQWLHGRIETTERPEARARYEAAASQASLFNNLIERASAHELTMTQVRRFLEEAHHGMMTSAAFPRQAGLIAIASPGGVVAPIERIVWWGYTRSSAALPRVPHLTQRELEVLQHAGIELPTPADLARQAAERGRRPFLMATETLWLVCPRHEANGEEATPHPSWDEVAGRVKTVSHLERLVRPKPLLMREVHTHRPSHLSLPKPQLEWQTRPLDQRETESPSSIESLLGCSLNWALTYPGKLRAGAAAGLPSGDQLLGSVSHHVLLERVLRRQAETADERAQEALRVFAAEGPALAATLFLPGGSAERGMAEQVLASSARALHRLVAKGWAVESTETALTAPALGTTLLGVPDLVLQKGSARAVVDLKWSGGSYRRRLLEEGLAFQLAAYAHLLEANGAATTEVAYFILTTQSLLTASNTLTDRASTLKTVRTPAETWALFEKTWRASWKRVAAGVLTAPGVVEDAAMPETAIDEDGQLTLQPPCHFCDFAGVCGRRYGRVEVPYEED